MNAWSGRSDYLECTADRREFVEGAYNLFSPPQTSAMHLVLPVIAGYVLGKTLFGRR